MDIEKIVKTVREVADAHFGERVESGCRVIEIFMFPWYQIALVLLAQSPDWNGYGNTINLLACEERHYPEEFAGKRSNDLDQITVLAAAKDLHQKIMCLSNLSYEKALIVNECGLVINSLD